MNDHFKSGLIECIKIAGETIIENAEDIAGDTEYMSHLSISIDFDPDNASIPEITINRSHWPASEKLDRIYNAFHPKEGTDDGQ